MRYTEYHAGKAVIKDKNKLSEAMEKLARLEDAEEKDRLGQWIPCSERLPDESGTYIVNAIENGIIHVTFAKWMPRMKRWNLTGSRSYWKVTAWMSLPEPYQWRNSIEQNTV